MDYFSAGGGNKCLSSATLKISVIIVNWNAGSQLRACVDSIIEHGSNLVSKIIVVDNGSSDGSDKSVEDLSEVLLIRAGKNLGFGKACNLGARHAESEYLLFLNPDAMLYEGALASPFFFMANENNRNIGICGIQLVDKSGKVERTCMRFPSLGRFAAQILGFDKTPMLKKVGMHMKEWDHMQSKSVDLVLGAFFMVRRNMFESLGGFDERFFVYFEETDFSLRARKTGYNSVYLADTQAYHAGGGVSRQVKAERLFYSLRSRLLYGLKNFNLMQAWVLIAITVLIEPAARIFYCLVKGESSEIRNILKGYQLLIKEMMDIIKSKYILRTR